MKDLPIVDMHTHTDNSPDGNHSAIYMAESAEEMGLSCIAFTDHCDVDVYYRDEYDRRSVQSFFEVSKARKAFEGRLDVLRGIELGEAHYVPELSEKIINMQNYDVIIGSIHNLREHDDFCYWKIKDEAEITETMNQYFTEIANMIQWGNIDVVAHLTYPFRYIFNEKGYIEDITKYQKTVDEILKLCAEKDKALEINTGGLNYPIKAITPDLATLKRYKELGGKLISVGSDSHYADRIALGISKAYEMAIEAGFKCVTRFDERKASEIAIV